jgi:DNA-binding winged helix-turn-helix (wHTH) protein/Tol biopolymer transport system component
MNTAQNGDHRIRFGVFEADLSTRELYKRGMAVRVQDKPFQVLSALLEHPGDLVTREDLRKQLWPGGTYVDFEKGLNTAVKKLRATLGDSSDSPIFVETVPRRGYRFIAPVTYEREDLGLTNSDSAPLPHTPAPERNDGNAPPAPAPNKSFTWWRGRYAAVVLVAVLACAAALIFLSRVGNRAQPGIEISQQTESGNVGAVAIAPDGRYAAYVAAYGEAFSLRLRQVATRTEAEILPPEPGEIGGLTFSPASDYLYFVRADKNDWSFRYLYRVALVGGAVEKLITDVDSPVSFSPDGKQLAYKHFVPPQNNLELKVAGTDGSRQHVVAIIHNTSFLQFGPGLSWSPDGKLLALSASLIEAPRRWIVAAVSLHDGSVRELFHSPKRIGRPVWVPTTDRVIVPLSGALPHHEAQLWSIAYPSGAARRLTSSLSGFTDNLDINHDGTTIAAVTKAERSEAWLVSAADPSQGQQITSGEPAIFLAVQAPDKSILATSDFGLWKLSPDGKQRSLFYADADPDFEASRCGEFTLIRSLKSGTIALVRADNSGGHFTELTGRGNPFSPVCSPDAKYVFYLTLDQPESVWRIPIQGGEPRFVAKIMGDGLTGILSLSPDGRLLSYPFTQYTNTPAPGWHLAVVSLKDGSSKKVLDVPSMMNEPRWSQDGSAIQYLLTQNGVTNLWERPLTGESPKQLTHFVSGHIFSYSWSIDRRQLLLTRGEISGNLVLIRNFH